MNHMFYVISLCIIIFVTGYQIRKMAMKEWLQWLPPPRSVLALLLAVAGFSGRLFASHVTHSPTLLVDTCHSLCRLVGLITTVLAYKVLSDIA